MSAWMLRNDAPGFDNIITLKLLMTKSQVHLPASLSYIRYVLPRNPAVITPPDCLSPIPCLRAGYQFPTDIRGFGFSGKTVF